MRAMPQLARTMKCSCITEICWPGTLPHVDDDPSRGVGVCGTQLDGGRSRRRQQSRPRGEGAYRLQRHPRLRRQEGQPVWNGESVGERSAAL